MEIATVKPSFPARLGRRAAGLYRAWEGSNLANTWQDWLGLALVAVGVAVCWDLTYRLALGPWLLVVAFWLATASLFLRRFWLRLIGPLFGFEFERSLARTRFLLLRIYVYFILLLLITIGASWGYAQSQLQFPVWRAARVAQNIFYAWLAGHMLLSLVITPAYVGAAIAQERFQHTLDAILATDLRNREIVLGKLLVCLANLGMMLVTGLPILVIMQIQGNVNPDMVGAGFVAIVAAVFSLACVALYNSVEARRTKEAVLLTYALVGAYLALTSVAFLLTRRWRPAPWFHWGSVYVSPRDLIELTAWGNPVVAFIRLADAQWFRGSALVILPTVLVEFALFHLGAGLAFVGLAIARLRRPRSESVSKMPRRSGAGLRVRRPPVGRWPLLWKEVFLEGSRRPPAVVVLIVVVVVVFSFLPVAGIADQSQGLTAPISSTPAEAYGEYARWTGAGILCLLLVGLAVRASALFGSERERRTWESLFACPVSAASVVGAKWLGCLLSLRWPWLWLAAVWGVGLFAGNLPWSLVIASLVFWCVYAAVIVLLGQWFSLVCKSSMQAMICTLATLGVMMSGTFLLPDPLWQIRPDLLEWDEAVRQWLICAQMGLTPLVVLARFMPTVVGMPPPPDMPEDPTDDWQAPFAIYGLICWALAGVVLGYLVVRKLRLQTCRERYRARRDAPADLVEPAAALPT